MKGKNLTPLLLLVVVMGMVWAGCESRDGLPLPNQPPNTRISAGPPEASDTSFNINLFWFGWDDDGFVDFYEIAWESPDEGNWEGPIFTNDSLFTVEASESCCVDPLPEHGDPWELIYEQFHTFYVRAVDDEGDRDDTPSVLSFNAKTIAPRCGLIRGPSLGGTWGTRVDFAWTSEDLDGFVTSYRYLLQNTNEYFSDTEATNLVLENVLAWVDTLQFTPDGTGGYIDTLPAWNPTDEDTISFPQMATTSLGERHIFAVRAIDNAGAEETILQAGENMVWFKVSRLLDGPSIWLFSNIAGNWRSGSPSPIREVFAGEGLRFNWRANPGDSGTPVAGFSYAVDDTAQWSPFSRTSTEWPVQTPNEPEVLWFPPVGPHSFFVRAVDESGFIRALAAQLRVFGGPRFCPRDDRFVLVVLDTVGGQIIVDGFWPQGYEEVERGLVTYWFEGYDVQIHETSGFREPQVSLMNCASSCFWFHSAFLESDGSVLNTYHQVGPNTLPSYLAAGGNLFICGIQPLNALRWFEDTSGERTFQQSQPVDFLSTVTDTTLIPHWVATQLGIEAIITTVDFSNFLPLAERLRTARSVVTDGPNPYPDLEFDPLTWPQGTTQRGFGFYDKGIIPIDTGNPELDTEPIYMFNDTNFAVGARRLSPNGPGPNGNVVYLGLHPYFVHRPQFKTLVQAVMADFGEFPLP